MFVDVYIQLVCTDETTAKTIVPALEKLDGSTFISNNYLRFYPKKNKKCTKKFLKEALGVKLYKKVMDIKYFNVLKRKPKLTPGKSENTLYMHNEVKIMTYVRYLQNDKNFCLFRTLQA